VGALFFDWEESLGLDDVKLAAGATRSFGSLSGLAYCGFSNVQPDNTRPSREPMSNRQRLAARATAIIDREASLGGLHKLAYELATLVLDFKESLSKGV